MSNEQLGTGNPADANTVAGDLIVGGSIAANGVTTAPARPTIATVTTTSTADLLTAVNATLDALADLGFVTKS